MSSNIHIYVGPNIAVKATREQLWQFTESIEEHLHFVNPSDAENSGKEDFRLLPNIPIPQMDRCRTWERTGDLPTVDSSIGSVILNSEAEYLIFKDFFHREIHVLEAMLIPYKICWSVIPYWW